MIGLDVIAQALLSGVFMGSIYALVAIGFTLVFGVTDIVNFAHGHLVMAAMFVTYVLFKAAQIDPYLSLVIVLPFFFGFGAELGSSRACPTTRSAPLPTSAPAPGAAGGKRGLITLHSSSSQAHGRADAHGCGFCPRPRARGSKAPPPRLDEARQICAEAIASDGGTEDFSAGTHVLDKRIGRPLVPKRA